MSVDAPPLSTLRPPGKRSIADAREIVRALVARDWRLKYKRSILGFLWSLVTPMMLAGVYIFVFLYIYHVDVPDFVLFLFSGLLAWQFFNMTLLTGTNSLTENAALIRKVYLPRHLIPMSSVISNLLNFLMTLSVLSIVLILSGRQIWLTVHWLLLAIVLETMLLCGVTWMLSVWNVYLRDIRQMISIFSVVLFFATPVVYDVARVPDHWKWVMFANPLASIMEVYRAALYRVAPPDMILLAIGLVETLVIFTAGWFIFKVQSRSIAKEL